MTTTGLSLPSKTCLTSFVSQFHPTPRSNQSDRNPAIDMSSHKKGNAKNVDTRGSGEPSSLPIAQFFLKRGQEGRILVYTDRLEVVPEGPKGPKARAYHFDEFPNQGACCFRHVKQEIYALEDGYRWYCGGGYFHSSFHDSDCAMVTSWK